MKVVAFNGSPRRNGNTAALVNAVFAPLQEAGIETELVQVGGHAVRGCGACMKCFENEDGCCVVKNDPMNEWIEKMRTADGIILASPTYFADVTAEMKALIDRAGFVTRVNGTQLRRKLGAAVVAVRRAGGMHAFDTINHFFTINEMLTVGSSYWNIGIGRQPGEVNDDEEGMTTMTNLGINMAWALKKLAD
jgi:multimeric flavodoxin WrbA